MALIMIVFMIALASAILISLTDSTYVAMRVNGAAEQRIKAEYILKSVVNVAQVLIKTDTNQFDDPKEDAWMMFAEGREVPGELLALPEPNIRVSLLITSTNAKIPLLEIYTTVGGAQPKWKTIVHKLFITLGFDQPLPMNYAPDSSPLPDSKQLVSNLIDYLDKDKENFPADGFFPPGIEETLPNGQTFPNSGSIDSLASELPAIPGFSPGRVQRLLPYITKSRVKNINVNAAPMEVLLAVAANETEAANIERCRNPAAGGRPIQNTASDLSECGVTDPNNLFAPEGKRYEVIAKVEYGTAMFIASADLDKTGAGRLPKIESFQMY
jgi:hypothetical protein